MSCSGMQVRPLVLNGWKDSVSRAVFKWSTRPHPFLAGIVPYHPPALIARGAKIVLNGGTNRNGRGKPAWSVPFLENDKGPALPPSRPRLHHRLRQHRGRCRHRSCCLRRRRVLHRRRRWLRGLRGEMLTPIFINPCLTYCCGSKPCTPGEHQNRCQMDVHRLQTGAIGYAPWPYYS